MRRSAARRLSMAILVPGVLSPAWRLQSWLDVTCGGVCKAAGGRSPACSSRTPFSATALLPEGESCEASEPNRRRNSVFQLICEIVEIPLILGIRKSLGAISCREMDSILIPDTQNP